MMQNNRIKTILSPTSRQTIAAMLMNFVSTIPDGEEIEIAFNHEETKGSSHMHFDALRKSRTPDIERTVHLTDSGLSAAIDERDKLETK